MSTTPNKDLFSMTEVDKTPSTDGLPPPLLSKIKSTGRDLSSYRVRVERYVIDDMSDDLTSLESLLSRCLDPKDDSAWLLERKDNFNEGVFVTIAFYLEKRPE